MNIVCVDGFVGVLLLDDDVENGFFFWVKLNVIIEVNNRIFVCGWGLDMEWLVLLKIIGMVVLFVLDGNFVIVCGFFDFGGCKFDFEKGCICFDFNGGLDLFLDIVVVNEIKFDIKVGLKVGGWVLVLVIFFYVEFSLFEDDVMVYVFFGKLV